MSVTWKHLLIGVFLLGFVGLLGVFNVTKPRILVLHTSDQTWPWASRVDQGIQQTLDGNRRPVSVKWYYLGLNRRFTADQRHDAVVQARRAIERIDPDVLIAVDDESNALVARDYAGRARPRLVFTAMVQPPARYGYADAPNVSGIREQLPLVGVREALRVVHPDQPARIAALAVDNETGRAHVEQVQSFDWTPHRLAATATVGTFGDWQSFVTQVADQADVLLVLNYRGLDRGDGNHQAVPGEEIAAWTETNARPFPLGIPENYVKDGGGLGISPSPLDFGQQAMRMALDWLDRPTVVPPVATSSHFRVAVRSARLAARQVELPPIYVEAARLGGAYYP